MPYIGVSPQFGVRRKHTYTATASQTSFSGAGAEGATLSYTDSNFVDVYQNGVKLGDADYTSTSGTAIVLGTGATVNDIIEIIVFDAFSAADTVSKADGGQFDGNVTMGGTLAVTGTTALTGNATMAGTLGVTGTQTNNGNLVVSKATPNVDIKDTGTAQASMDFLSNSDTVRATIGMERSAGGGLFVGSSAYSAVFGTASSGNTEFATNNNIRMVIDSSGNVGINESNPSSSLHIFGSSPKITLEHSNENGTAQIYTTAQSAIVLDADPDNTDNGTPIIFNIDGSERMRIDDNGDTFINTTSDPTPFTAKFCVVGTGNVLTARTTSSSGATVAAFQTGTYNGSVNIQNFYNNSGGTMGTISATNGLNGTSVSFNTSSDYRLKENVTADWNATTRLKQLNPVRFNFIIDADTTVDGFLAHEVQSVVPEAVTGEKDAMTKEVLYVDGDEIPDGKKVGDVKTASQIDPQGIDQSKLVPLLVKTIQELEARITALENAE